MKYTFRVPFELDANLHQSSTGAHDRDVTLIHPRHHRLSNSTRRGGAVKRWCARASDMTALLGQAALLIPGYECYSPVAPSDFDRPISGYRLIWGYRLIGGLYPYSDTFYFLFRRMGKNEAQGHHTSTSCVDLTQLHSQSSACTMYIAGVSFARQRELSLRSHFVSEACNNATSCTT